MFAGGRTASALRVAIPAACVWLAAALLIGVPERAVCVAVCVALTLGVTAGIAVAVRRRPPIARLRAAISVVLLALLLVLATAVCVVVGLQKRSSPAVLAATSTPVDLDLEIRLARDIEPRDRAWSASLVAVQQGDPMGGADARSTGHGPPVRVIPPRGERVSHIGAGAVVRIQGRLVPTEPGDAAVALIFARTTPLLVSAPHAADAWTDAARTAFAGVVAPLPAPGAGLLRGLAIGDRSGIDDGTDAAMRAVALTHLTAVSGSNCAVLVALVEGIGRALRVRTSVRLIVSLVVLGLFLALVRPDPSIVRATIMAVVVLLSASVGRRGRGIPLLALAVVVMILMDPWIARSFGFTLSVLATAGVFVVAPVLAAALARRLPAAAAAAIAVPVAAQVACWPVTVLLAPEIPTFAVPVNIVAEPLAPVATVFGLGACLTAPLVPGLASVLATIAWLPATAIAMLARAAAQLPAATIPWPPGPLGAAVAAGVSLAVIAAVLGSRGLRPAAAASAGVLVISGVALVAVPQLVVRGTLPGDWSVAMCDVGQGDATVLRDGEHVALIDTGRDDELLKRCLDLLGIDRVSVLVVTHFDEDHVRAAPSIASSVDTVLIGPVARPGDQRIVDDLLRGGADVRRVAAGDVVAVGDYALRILWPEPHDEAGGNPSSVVVSASATREGSSLLSALLLGDLGERAQRSLRHSAALSTASAHALDVVKVSHHGSADQDASLYAAVGARIGLIGVGADNGYGHPTQRALSMLDHSGTAVFRTDERGTTVLSRSTDHTIRVWAERNDAAAAGARARQPSDLHSTLPPTSERSHARETSQPVRSNSATVVVGRPRRSGGARHRAGAVPRRAGDTTAPAAARRHRSRPRDL